VRFTCSPEPPNDRSTLDCYDALRDVGDVTGATRELDRVRALLGEGGAAERVASMAIELAGGRGEAARSAS
jgi:hypothetical protein